MTDLADMAKRPSTPATPSRAHAARREGGFTLMETLVVVGIMVALMGVAFVGLMQMWKDLQQTELDATAKEIYVAAQNHLALAESQGLLEPESKISLGESESVNSDVYYFVYAPGVEERNSNNPDWKATALNLMLPFGAIDETVRAGGSYVIRYQPSTATVLDVFYAKPDKDWAGFTMGDEQTLINGYLGESNKGKRQDFNGTGKIIGYYGAEEKRTPALKLTAPTLQVINGDTLQVKVTDLSDNNEKLSEYNQAYEKSDTLKMAVVIEGEESKACMWFDSLLDADEPNVFVIANELTVVLDDVTTLKGHFYSIADSRPDARKKGSSKFIPGENLRIYAWVTSTGSAVVAKTAATSSNSLFARKITVGGGYEASIMSFRHLENLSGEISHFNYKVLYGASHNVTGFNPLAVEYSSVTAKQETDLNWNDFKGMASSHELAQVRNDNGKASDPGTFLPVSPNYKLQYEGESHSIFNLKVNASGGAGLFSAITASSSSVSNLVLVSPDVTSSDAVAGALAGEIGSGVTVENVLARDGLSGSGATSQVVGATSAGGLVGIVNGGAIRESAAAVYVSATGNGAAGGLVGTAQNSATVRDSYSGGHTVSGEYASASSGGRMNVSGANAGGLAGALDGATVTNCYSTCSANGSATSGGFVGSASGGSVVNCYATGLVSGGTSGAFAGAVSDTLLSGDWYFGFVNQGTSATGNNASGGVAAFDESVELYNTFATGSASSEESPTGASNAVPYDEVLARNYNGKYPFRTIAALRGFKGDAAPMLVGTHVGDWPSPESLAKNYQ